ncbi:58_t:CDS:2 [Entrophospora sp. SA101]|nr:58_t:CDS:2 [Entrophospora sp. SA101]CAJ0823331.1 12603_t:CDS:2 [Entrophospora sp. SA101]CAJ0908582.1 7222_t:CDS:2 [Entrophospora sp. SA101]
MYKLEIYQVLITESKCDKSNIIGGYPIASNMIALFKPVPQNATSNANKDNDVPIKLYIFPFTKMFYKFIPIVVISDGGNNYRFHTSD